MSGMVKSLDKLVLADCHVHPDFSVDAHGTAEGFVRRALELGLTRICMTTHIDLDPHRAATDLFWKVHGRTVCPDANAVRTYLNDIGMLRKKYEDDIDIIAGFEFSYEPHFHDEISQFIEVYKPEFSIGSVHAIETIEITSSYFASTALRCFSPQEVIKKYYEYLVLIARSGLFTTIGHIDIYKKYFAPVWGLSLCEKIEAEYIEGAANAIARTGMSIEINTSALRRGFPAPYPDAVLIRKFFDAGVGIEYLGSDAHHPDYVGYRFADARNYIAGSII